MTNDYPLTHFHRANNWSWGEGDGYIWQAAKCLDCNDDITRRQYTNGIYTEWIPMP